jgi:hypothetical protein
MSDIFSFITDAGRRTYEFFDELKTIGVEIKNEHVAEVYSGHRISLKYQLVLKKGLFSKEVVLGSDNKSDLDTIRDYVGYFPQFSKLTVVESPLIIDSGCFVLKHVSRMTGYDGKRKEIEQLVQKWNGGKEVIEWIFTSTEETFIGFFPTSNQRLVKAYTDLINAGATREATPEEIIEIQNQVSDYVKKNVSTEQS